MKIISNLLAITLVTGAVATTRASVISWNLDNNGTVGDTAGGSSTNQAGVVPAANWNNSWSTDPTVDLMDNTGAATTLDLSYSSFNTYSIGGHPGQDADGSFNRELLNGYLNAGPAGWNPPITNSYVSLSQIPYAVYDIYVYFSADVADRFGYATDGTTSFYFSTLGTAAVSGGDALLAQTTETSSANHPLASYAVFSGLTGASQTISVQMEVADQWGGIAGFQVVSVPEPSSFALAGLGIAGLLIFRRRR